MNSKEFVQGLVRSVHESSIAGVVATLRSPSGRRPAVRVTELSEWFKGLSEADQLRLTQVIELAVHSALFGTLCVLDGVRAVEDSPTRAELHLLAVGPTGAERLNSPDAGPLHDFYQACVFERVFNQKVQ
ncbi:hypothetical protein [Mitsuaria sp. 7]|uniref:hypothetical protein n=1 Tax=Mitsuaria sp. 7 TaxID=1658665 RepID=UPI0012FC6ABF|nr:hypothetical protein [Mitsuaria sp. 7]